MVVVNVDTVPLADIIFIIEGTAINGAYLNDIKSNYIIPTLEYFNQGTLEERDYLCESASALYGIVIYHAADRLPSPSTDIYGPYSNPRKVLQLLDKMEMVGGRGESHANIAEALAASLVCLEDLQLRRETSVSTQKHCILICNSPPYLMPVSENQSFAGNTADQLAAMLAERNVHLSILSPRKIPALFKLYEKAGGDLSASQTKNYAKDPRHLVLLKGFSLKERSVSPTGGAALNIGSLSSPLSCHGSPMAQPQPAQPPQTQPQASMLQGAGGAGVRGFVTSVGGYHQGVRPGSRWPMMPPQQRPGFTQQPGSALIEQLTRPPSALLPTFSNHYNVSNVTDSGLVLFTTGVQPGLTGQQQQQVGPAAAVVAQQQQQAAVVVQQQQQSAVVTQQQQQSAVVTQQQQQAAVVAQQQQQAAVIAQHQQQAAVIAHQQQNTIVTQQQTAVVTHQQQAALVAQQQQQAAVVQQHQQQMRMLASRGDITSQPGVMGQSQLPQQQNSNIIQPQQGVINPQQGVLTQQGSMLVSNAQVTGTISQQTVIGPQQPNQVMGQNQQQQTGRERQNIWHGILEWAEKPKHQSDTQKIIRHVPCFVSVAVKDGEPELKADSWPQKLIMQLMPKQLIGNIGSAYLRNSKTVIFHPTSCEALDALTKVMSSGFAGCVHFTNLSTACDIRVLILLYTAEKKSYYGFIPNDQVAFVERLRKIIQQQKNTGLTKQTQGVGQAGANIAGNHQSQQQPTQQIGNLLQQQQQSINAGFAGVGPGTGLNMGALQVDASQQQPAQVASNQGGGQSGFNNQTVEAARQENLFKIHRLRQNLEAAQQQELQFKNQLELMKIQQMQDSLQHAQLQEIQYKTQLEQEQQKQQLRAQLQQMQQQQVQQQQLQQQQSQVQQQQPVRGIAPQQQPGQQGIMRQSTMSNNPGLRHLLQQPQYRLNMQQHGCLPTQAGQQQTAAQQQFDDTYDF